MKKIKKKCLDELANMVELISNEYQMAYVGGGDGSYADPYTDEDMDTFTDDDWTRNFYYYDDSGVRCYHNGTSCIVYGSGSYGSGSYGSGSYSYDDDTNCTSYSDYLKAVANGTWAGGYVMDGGVAVYIGPDDSINNKNTGGDGNSDIVRQAEKYQGLKYGATVDGYTLDCSGLVTVALGTYGKGQRWTTASGTPKGTSKVSFVDIQEGDVLCWRWKNAKGEYEGHAVIYAGGGKVIHAGRTGGICKMDLDYWTNLKGTPNVYRRY